LQLAWRHLRQGQQLERPQELRWQVLLFAIELL
jgi:hypothetical protein